MDFSAERIDLSTIQFTPELLRCVPAATARKHRALPVADSPGCLSIALADIDLYVIDALAFTLNRELAIRIADGQQLDMFLRRLYAD